MLQVCSRSFIIHPPDNLLETAPQLRRASHALALSYAHHELVTDERLQAIGTALWADLKLDKPFAHALDYAGNTVLPLIIESDSAAIQNLPWEILYHPEHGFLGRAQRFSLSRKIPVGETETKAPEQGPLRILLFTSLPDNVDAERGRLEVEEEQEFVLEALINEVVDGRVKLEMPDDGRFSTLQQWVRDFQPHLLFLSGHGQFHIPLTDDKEPYGVFLFEDEQGLRDEVTDKVLAEALHGSSLQCVVLSACESGKACSDQLSQGLARRLIQAKLPHVIGMRESILDSAGIQFAQHFCGAISRQERIDIALQQARQAITQPLKDTGYSDKSGATELSLSQWCLPNLFSLDCATPLINWCFTPTPPESFNDQKQLEGVSLPEKFRGRRKELRQLSAQLMQGKIKQLLITGPGGQGKTALAGKLALTLQAAEWEVVAWSAKDDKSWNDFLLDLQFKLNKDNSEWFDRVLAQVKDPQKQAYYLLERLLLQYRGRLLILLDNLESIQDSQTRTLNHAAIQAFINAAQQQEQKGLRVLLTSRWLLPSWYAEHWPLEHLSYGDFLQLCLLKHQQLGSLARRGQRLRRVYQVLNGNGRGLYFFAAAVQGMPLKEEVSFLEKLSKAESDIQTDMALDQLLMQCTDAQLTLLTRMQWYEGPVPIEGIERLLTDLENPKALLGELAARSLVETSYHPRWKAKEYQCPELIIRALANQEQTQHQQHPGSLDLTYAQVAADYHIYLFDNERGSFEQARVVHRGLRRANKTDQAHQFALDWIVGYLNRAGLYHTLLSEWLPEICDADDKQVRAKALGQTGKQYIHIGQYQKALGYLKQSLSIQQDIGDRAGEGTTLNNISQIFKAQGEYETALGYLKQSLSIQQDIGDKAGLCATLFNIGHMHWQNKEQQDALSAWITVYRLAKPMKLTQVLEALEGLSEQLGMEGGLAAWEKLLMEMKKEPAIDLD